MPKTKKGSSPVCGVSERAHGRRCQLGVVQASRAGGRPWPRDPISRLGVTGSRPWISNRIWRCVGTRWQARSHSCPDLADYPKLIAVHEAVRDHPRRDDLVREVSSPPIGDASAPGDAFISPLHPEALENVRRRRSVRPPTRRVMARGRQSAVKKSSATVHRQSVTCPHRTVDSCPQRTLAHRTLRHLCLRYSCAEYDRVAPRARTAWGHPCGSLPLPEDYP